MSLVGTKLENTTARWAAASPAELNECQRKFPRWTGRSSLDFKDIQGSCVDCGNTWQHHLFFYCRKDILRETDSKAHSIIDSSHYEGYIIIKADFEDGRTLISGSGSTTSTNQEEKVFQVTNYNHATGALNNSAFKTQEEAQNNLEVQAAAARGNLQTKQFFTLSLLNTKTGQYLGSVSDLPPAVVLTQASPVATS